MEIPVLSRAGPRQVFKKVIREKKVCPFRQRRKIYPYNKIFMCD